jgi:chorismate synthase
MLLAGGVRLRFLTAGESHGIAEVTIVEGMPAGVPLTTDRLDAFLHRRQMGYGRGDRMRLETDQAQILSGVRSGLTTGAPIALVVNNRDHRENLSPVTSMRPGHADYAGALKYQLSDARSILERASARETVARVMVGGVAQALLDAFNIRIQSHVLAIGGVWAKQIPDDFNDLQRFAEASPVRCADLRPHLG